MKNKLLSLVVASALTLAVTTAAFASGNELAYKRIGELNELDAANIAAGDMIPVWDASTNQVKKVDATDFPYGGGAITLDDGAGASPNLVFKDGTDETSTFSKVDAGYLTLTTDATDGLNILTGSLKVGNGVPDSTINGEDLYVEGISEFDGAMRVDGAVTLNSTLTMSGVAALNGANTSTGSMTYTRTPSADSATTNNTSKVALTAPVDTTGTNTHQAYDVALTISNATGGTNKVNAFNVENVTGDAQVDVTGLRIGTGTTLGTSNAIVIGSGWDAGLVTDSAVQINSTNGTAITAIRFAFDAVASGQTSKTTTLTGATASSRCVASAAETATNAVYIRSVVPGTDQVVITTSGDPGASNMDYTVVCYN